MESTGYESIAGIPERLPRARKTILFASLQKGLQRFGSVSASQNSYRDC